MVRVADGVFGTTCVLQLSDTSGASARSAFAGFRRCLSAACVLGVVFRGAARFVQLDEFLLCA